MERANDRCVCGHLREFHESGYPGWCTACDPDAYPDGFNPSHGFKKEGDRG